VERLVFAYFLSGDFGAERDSSADDTIWFGGEGRRKAFEIMSRIALANVRGEGASVLRVDVIREVVSEVVVLLAVRTHSRNVLERMQINGCTTLPSPD